MLFGMQFKERAQRAQLLEAPGTKIYCQRIAEKILEASRSSRVQKILNVKQ